MSVRESRHTTPAVAADRALGIVIVITQVGGHAPIERLLVAHLDPVVRIALARVADQARVGKRKLLNRTLQGGQLGAPLR